MRILVFEWWEFFNLRSHLRRNWVPLSSTLSFWCSLSFWCGTEGVCWSEGFLVWNWGILGTEKVWSLCGTDVLNWGGLCETEGYSSKFNFQKLCDSNLSTTQYVGFISCIGTCNKSTGSICSHGHLQLYHLQQNQSLVAISTSCSFLPFAATTCSHIKFMFRIKVYNNHDWIFLKLPIIFWSTIIQNKIFRRIRLKMWAYNVSLERGYWCTFPV